MTTLFVSKPGQVVTMEESGALPLQIILDDFKEFPVIRAIITHLSSQQSGNYQFLHTLKDYIYVYVFGERIGDTAVTGLLFSEACAQPGQPSGFEQLKDYYEQHRLSKTGAPLTLQVGTSDMALVRGFLVGMRAEITDPVHQLGQFTLYLKTLHKEADRP